MAKSLKELKSAFKKAGYKVEYMIPHHFCVSNSKHRIEAKSNFFSSLWIIMYNNKEIDYIEILPGDQSPQRDPTIKTRLFIGNKLLELINEELYLTLA